MRASYSTFDSSDVCTCLNTMGIPGQDKASLTPSTCPGNLCRPVLGPYVGKIKASLPGWLSQVWLLIHVLVLLNELHRRQGEYGCCSRPWIKGDPCQDKHGTT